MMNVTNYFSKPAFKNLICMFIHLEINLFRSLGDDKFLLFLNTQTYFIKNKQVQP